MSIRRLAILVVPLMASACVTAPPPAAPVLTYARADCSPQADMAIAASLVPPREQAAHQVNAPLNAQAPCLIGPSGPTPYAVFALPPEYADKTLTVGGAVETLRILSPRVEIADRQGVVTRTFDADDFMHRGQVYSVQFRPRADDAYVIVSTEASRVGQDYESVVTGTSTTGTVAAGAYVSWTSGQDDIVRRTFSYEGSAVVIVQDTDVQRGR